MNEMRGLINRNSQEVYKYLAGVKSSSQSSIPMHVSTVLTTQSPNGTLTYLAIPNRF